MFKKSLLVLSQVLLLWGAAQAAGPDIATACNDACTNVWEREHVLLLGQGVTQVDHRLYCLSACRNLLPEAGKNPHKICTPMCSMTAKALNLHGKTRDTYNVGCTSACIQKV